MADIVLGQNQSTAKKQFEINPKLQRTQATGNRTGLTLGTKIFDYPIVQAGQIVLRNRRVPFNNSKENILKKVPANIINLLQVPTAESKGNFNTRTGSDQ